MPTHIYVMNRKEATNYIYFYYIIIFVKTSMQFRNSSLEGPDVLCVSSSQLC